MAFIMNEGRVDMCDSQCRCNFLTPTSKSTSISVSVLSQCCSIVEVGLNGMKSYYIASIPEFSSNPFRANTKCTTSARDTMATRLSATFEKTKWD